MNSNEIKSLHFNGVRYLSECFIRDMNPICRHLGHLGTSSSIFHDRIIARNP